MIAEQLTVFEAATRYLGAGLSVIPTMGKIASVDWKVYCQRRADRVIVERWQRAGVLNGIAVVCGAVSNNLVVLDLDGDDAVQAFAERFNHDDILDTWTVRSGSGHGMHIYWRVSGHMPRTTRALGLTIGNVELRGNGCYVVAPPSIHPAGGAYSVHHRAAIRRLENVEPVREWMHGLIRAKRRAADAAQPTRGGNVKIASLWARAALKGECENVRQASAGRNNALNRAAFKLGLLVGAGHLDRAAVETALMDAAAHLSADDGERQTLATIQSGLGAGIRKSQ